MKWNDAQKIWPGLGSLGAVVQGYAFLPLKDEYKMEGHEIGAYFKFYCLVEEMGFPNGGFGEDFSLEHAMFYEFDEFCCNAPEVKEAHEKHFKKIGCGYYNIRKFVNKKSLHGSWDCIERWAFLEEDNG